MTGKELQQLFDFDAALTIGQIVEIRWTNSHHYFHAKAKVVKLNEKSVKAELLVAVGVPPMNYPVGQVISAPRIKNFKGWTCNNCVQEYSEP